MKRKRFTEEVTIGVCGSMKTADLCRKHGTSAEVNEVPRSIDE
jgi:hypothetical protein